MVDNKESTGQGYEPSRSESEGAEPVWTFRGYKLRPGEFNTAMVHLFRAEINRANVWRQRLDSTTNWAVVTTGAAISFSFGQPTGHHSLILIINILVTMFLIIEARRYRYYELWSSRVRLMETDFFAAMLVPPFRPAADWAESLAESLLQPNFPITRWEAIGRRLRRNYIWIYIVLLLSWMAKIWLHPVRALSIADMIERARIGSLSGFFVMILWLGFFTLIFLFSLLTAGMHEASGEVFPRFVVEFEERKSAHAGQSSSGHLSAWFRRGVRRRQLLTLIITDKPEIVGDNILREMNRGVTEMKGKGMFTGSEHSILISALTVTEVAHLKEIVGKSDPNAFVIVTPAQEVIGKGFFPLAPEQR
jgi:uncharacterized membrane protein